MKKLILIAFLNFFAIAMISAQCKSGNCKNGTGIFIYPSGAKYIGQFKNGEIDGVGACYYTDGKKYQGEWKNRFPHGNGTMTLADGTTWTGNWSKGHPVDRSGKMIKNIFKNKKVNLEEDNIQTGCLVGDCKNGVGVFAYADGSKYEGNFRGGALNGYGTFNFANGDKYVGDFKDGFSHGEGTYYHKEGRVTSGDWTEGEFVSAKDNEFEGVGCVAGDCENGYGTYIYEGGEAKYVGHFKGGESNGQGAIYYINGEKYVGDWLEGAFEGYGTLYPIDGPQVKGWWQEGTFMGKKKPAKAGGTVASNDKPSKTTRPNKTTKPSTTKVLSPEDAKAEIRRKAGFKVYAVVIGVSSYNHMPALRYTDDDAYRMYAFLKSPAGGALPDNQISVLIDEEATKSKIASTMKKVFNKAGANDLIMLYFSGHGLKGSFLPIDFDGFNNKLAHEEINRIMEDSPAKYKLCIADACHSGSLFAARSTSELQTLETYYATLAQAEAGTALLMSSKSDETSLESSGLRQGVFSHFLIRGLKGEGDANKNGIVSIQELYDFVNANVRSYTGNRQSPLLKGDFDKTMTVSVVE